MNASLVMMCHGDSNGARQRPPARSLSLALSGCHSLLNLAVPFSPAPKLSRRRLLLFLLAEQLAPKVGDGLVEREPHVARNLRRGCGRAVLDRHVQWSGPSSSLSDTGTGSNSARK